LCCTVALHTISWARTAFSILVFMHRTADFVRQALVCIVLAL